MTGCSSNLLFIIVPAFAGMTTLSNLRVSALISGFILVYHGEHRGHGGKSESFLLGVLAVHALWLLFGLAHCFYFLVSERPVVDSQVGHLERPVRHVAAVRLADGPVVP